jgi:hypothetical protein
MGAGIAAGAFADGFYKGYSLIEKSIADKEERERKQQEAEKNLNEAARKQIIETDTLVDKSNTTRITAEKDLSTADSIAKYNTAASTINAEATSHNTTVDAMLSVPQDNKFASGATQKLQASKQTTVPFARKVSVYAGIDKDGNELFSEAIIPANTLEEAKNTDGSMFKLKDDGTLGVREMVEGKYTDKIDESKGVIGQITLAQKRSQGLSGYDVIPQEDMNPAVISYLKSKNLPIENMTRNVHDATLKSLTVQPDQTEKEARIDNLVKTDAFKKKYGHLPAEEQKETAYKMINPKEFSSDKALEFYIDNGKNTIDGIATNAAKLDKVDVFNITKGQKNSSEYKDFSKNVSGSADGAIQMNKQADVIIGMINKNKVTFGIVQDTVDNAFASVPDNWITLSTEDKRKWVNKITGNAMINNLFFTYLNQVNKGAPSDKDAEIMKEVIKGLNSGNNSTVKAALTQFMTTINNEVYDNYDRYAPSVYLAAKNEYDAVKKLKFRGNYKGVEGDNTDGKDTKVGFWNGNQSIPVYQDKVGNTYRIENGKPVYFNKK